MDNFKITEKEIQENNVKNAPDTVRADTGSGYTARDVKNIFDRLPELIITKFNAFLDELNKQLTTIKNKVPTKTSQLDNDSGYITSDDVPVKSVNGQTGDVKIELPDNIVTKEQLNNVENKIPTKTSQLKNDSGYLTAGDIPNLPSGDDGKDGFSVYKSSAEAVSNGPMYYSLNIADIDTNGRELQVDDLVITPSGKMYSIYILHTDELSVTLKFYTSIKGNDGLSVFKATANPYYSDSTGYYISSRNVDSVDRTVQTGDFILSPDGKLYRVIPNTDTRVFYLELYLGLKAEFTESDKAELTEDVAQKLVEDGTIPTKTSQLENDSGLAYKADIPTSLPASDVYSWAKQPNKPSYTKSEVGLGNVDNVKQYSASNPPPYPVTSVNGQGGNVEVEPKGTAQTKVINHNADEKAHSYILLLIEELTARFNAFMDSDDTTLDQASEMIAYIKANRELIESITTAKVNVTDIIDNLTTSVSDKPLSAKQGVQLKALIDAIKVPTKLSELAEDTTHRVVTDAEKTAWNAKSNFSGSYNDLTNKPTIPTVPTKVSAFDNDANYLKSTDQQTVINNALAQAKASGEFDGEDGQRGFSLLRVTSAPTSYTTATGGFTPAYRIALSTVKSQSKAAEVLVGDTLAYSYYQYPIGYVDGSYVYLGARVSIRGAAYTLNDADKEAIVQAVLAALPSAEQWTFELEDGTTVVKEVFADDI